MAREIFVDTSGFYSLLVQRDDKHKAASAILRQAAKKRRRFLTNDYVLDETATLLKARGVGHLLAAFFSAVFESDACRVQWTDAEQFTTVRNFYLKHVDQAWSFTDCVSFLVMKEHRLLEALTKDEHFEEAGFVALLK
jgi:predicted nucleic acid-binding protein